MKGSTVFLVILGLIIASLGGLFVVLMGMSFMRAVDQRAWPQVQGVVISSEIEEYRYNEFSSKEYRLIIRYGYDWKGDRKTGERYGFRGNPKYNKRNKIEDLMSSYPVGEKVTVYVNPADENFTMLKPDSKAAGYSIWFPMLFVIGGLGIAIRAIRSEQFAQSLEGRA